WVTETDFPYLREHDPMEPRAPLPGRDSLASAAQAGQAHGPRSQPSPEQAPRRGEPSSGGIRTALCVEVRNGVLCIFLPPVPDAGDYLELAAAIESTAAELAMPVLLEGYTPPYDPRLEHFQITPDPGVIEVNVAPATCWDRLVDQTTTLYEEARQARLTTDKFML